MAGEPSAPVRNTSTTQRRDDPPSHHVARRIVRRAPLRTKSTPGGGPARIASMLPLGRPGLRPDHPGHQGLARPSWSTAGGSSPASAWNPGSTYGGVTHTDGVAHPVGAQLRALADHRGHAPDLGHRRDHRPAHLHRGRLRPDRADAPVDLPAARLRHRAAGRRAQRAHRPLGRPHPRAHPGQGRLPAHRRRHARRPRAPVLPRPDRPSDSGLLDRRASCWP